MKKFLVILMVVAMASFLFVGCLPSVTPEVEPVVPVVPVVKTETPFITSIGDGKFAFASTATQTIYVLNVEAVAAVGSVVKLYVNDVWVGTGSAGAYGVTGTIGSSVTLTDGVKTIYVTATQAGLAESEKSTIYTATLNTAAPKIASAVADSSANTITVTFDKAVNTVSLALAIATETALNPVNYSLNGTPLVSSVIVKVSAKVVRIDLALDTPTAVQVQGTMYTLACKDIEDTYGNAMAATFITTYIGVSVE